MKLTIVGASGSMSGPEGPASSYLVQVNGSDEDGVPRIWSVVFDLGPGAFGALWNYVNPRELDAVVFTHGHADHMGDSVSMYVHNRWNPSGCMERLNVYGPAQTRDRIKQIDGSATDEELETVFDFHAVVAREAFVVGPLRITPYPALHPVETYGYRIEASRGFDSATMAFTGDTDMCPAIVEMADGVDLLLSEAAFTTADTLRGMHLDGVRAGQLAADAQVGQLVITHVQPWTDKDLVAEEVRTTWNGPLGMAAPGQVYSIGDA